MTSNVILWVSLAVELGDSAATNPLHRIQKNNKEIVMAMKKMRSTRGGAQTSTTDDDVLSTDLPEEEEGEEDAESEEPLEVVTKRLVAPRLQGITKTILSGIDEMTKITFFSKIPEAEVCVIDTTNTEDEIVVVTVHAHPWATDLAIDIWNEVEVDALDPNTCNPSEDGWVCTYPMQY